MNESGDSSPKSTGQGECPRDYKHSSSDEALRDCMIQLSNVLEITGSGQWEYDVLTDTFTFNDNFYRVYRTTAEKAGGYKMLMSEYMRRFCHPDDFELVIKEITKLLESPDPETARQLQHRMIYGDGETGYMAVRFLAVRDSDGNIVRTYGVNQDITGFKKIENEHIANLKFFESMEKVNRALQETDHLEKMMEDVLDEVLEIFGCDRAFLLYPCDPDALSWVCPMERTRPEFPGIHNLGLEMPVDREFAGTFRILNESCSPVKFGPGTEHPIHEKVSARFNIQSIMSMAIYPKTGKPWQFGIQQCTRPRIWTSEEEKLFQETGRRIADSLTTLIVNRELKNSEEKFRTLFMSMSDGFYLSEVIYDDNGDPRDYRYLEVNPEFERIVGRQRDLIIGKTYRELVPVDTTQWLDNYFRVAVTGKPGLYEFYSAEYLMYFETYSYCPVRGQVSVIVRNITSRKKLEEQLRHAQKMEAIGRMAGGIAHDFNNVLTAIMGCGALLEIKMDKHDPLRRYVGEIMTASMKAVDLTRSLSVFSRQQPVTYRPLPVNSIIKGLENLLKRLVTEDITIKTVLAEEEPVIMGDESQVDQVFFNLVSNARDAMPGGGMVVIETKQVELDDEFRRIHGYGEPGSYVLISVSDTGSGMDESIKQMIFEPFFTTKEEGRGTGLGLANVYGIVKQHDGYITVYSEPGLGTTFRLFFPVAVKAVTSEEPHKEHLRGGNEVILLAEDNASVRSLMKDILAGYGYTIIEAVDGTDAVKQYVESGKIDLIVLDSVMPGKNGLEVYNEIYRMKPALKVLFTSGYTKDIILDKGIEEKKFDLISKPVHPADLVKKVREILDR